MVCFSRSDWPLIEDGPSPPARAGRVKAASERKRASTVGEADGCGLEATEHAATIEKPRRAAVL
jgi:hypothetical protein